MLAKPRAKKEPITPDMLRLFVYTLSDKSMLTEVWLVASALLAYTAFLFLMSWQGWAAVSLNFRKAVCHSISAPVRQTNTKR